MYLKLLLFQKSKTAPVIVSDCSPELVAIPAAAHSSQSSTIPPDESPRAFKTVRVNRTKRELEEKMEGNQSAASAADDGNDGKRPAAAKPSADASSASSNPSRKRRKVEASGNVEDEMRMETSSSNSSSDDEDDDDKNPSLGSRSSSDIDGSNDKPGVDPVLLQHAKNRLSKFAARLFDPNRPKARERPKDFRAVSVSL